MVPLPSNPPPTSEPGPAPLPAPPTPSSSETRPLFIPSPDAPSVTPAGSPKAGEPLEKPSSHTKDLVQDVVPSPSPEEEEETSRPTTSSSQRPRLKMLDILLPPASQFGYGTAKGKKRALPPDDPLPTAKKLKAVPLSQIPDRSGRIPRRVPAAREVNCLLLRFFGLCLCCTRRHMIDLTGMTLL